MELQFPLTKLTTLQKRGMGAKRAESVLVRLRFGSQDSPSGYCVHLSDERAPGNKDPHTPRLMESHDRAPNQPYCHGIPNLAAYQLSRMLWRHLQGGFESLEETYTCIAHNVADLALRCVVCRTHHVVPLRRSTVCKSRECHALFMTAHFELHIGDLWMNPTVVDCILSSMYATTLRASTVHTVHPQGSLLHHCPITHPGTLQDVLNRLPPLRDLAKDLTRCMAEKRSEFSLSAYFRRFFKSRPQLASLLAKSLVWACLTYRGFLIHATGKFQIPGFGAASQFLLANSSPALEEWFARELVLANGSSRVLFHGTRLDRLHNILRNGLKVLSGTDGQRNGAVYGRGIYMSSDPVIAMGFAHTMDFEPPRISLEYGLVRAEGLGWKSSRFDGPGVLLVCEVAGFVHEVQSRVFVLKNAAKIMIRYVILLHRSDVEKILGDNLRYGNFWNSVPHFERAFAKLRSRSW